MKKGWVTRTCEVCGRTFDVRSFRAHSPKKYRAHGQEVIVYPARKVVGKCGTCGKEFETYQTDDPKHCSDKCTEKAKVKYCSKACEELRFENVHSPGERKRERRSS